MSKVRDLQVQLKNLQLQTSNLYSEILKENGGSINFLQQVEIDGDDDFVLKELRHNGEFDRLPTYEFRNSITGNVFDGHIMRIHENGIDVFHSEEHTKLTYGFSDMGSLEDQVLFISDIIHG